MGKDSKETFEIGSTLFLFLWIFSCILMVLSICYFNFVINPPIATYFTIVLLLVLIGLMMVPFAKGVSVGKLFSIQLKEINSSIERLRETIINIGIKNVQDVKVYTTIPAGQENIHVSASEKSAEQIESAKTLYKQGKIMEAIESYKRALNYDCENWGAAMALGYIYFSLDEMGIDKSEWGFSDEERLFKSIFYSTYATEKDKQHYNQYLNLGIAQGKLGGDKSIRVAIKNLEVAYNMLNNDDSIAGNPYWIMSKGKARSFMGEFEEKLGNTDKATEYRSEAIEIFNSCPDPKPHDLEHWKADAEQALNRLRGNK